MRTPRPRRENAPGRISLRLALLAFVLLVAQPSHWISCCLAVASGDHAAPSSSHSHAGAGARRSALRVEAHLDEDGRAKTHPATEPGAHGDEFIITPHCVQATHHHHPPCCAAWGAPALTQKAERPSAPDLLAGDYAAALPPAFRLDVLEGRFTRAGPPATPLLPPPLPPSLLGRAPPVSA